MWFRDKWVIQMTINAQIAWCVVLLYHFLIYCIALTYTHTLKILDTDKDTDKVVLIRMITKNYVLMVYLTVLYVTDRI